MPKHVGDLHLLLNVFYWVHKLVDVSICEFIYHHFCHVCDDTDIRASDCTWHIEDET